MRRYILFFLLLVATHLVWGQQLDSIYVNGDPSITLENRDGTREAPYKTIQGALESIPEGEELVVVNVINFSSDPLTSSVYQEATPLAITRSIELTTNDNAGPVILKPAVSANGPLVVIDVPDTVRLTKFILEGSAADTAVQVTSVDNLVVQSNEVRGFGVGIQIDSARNVSLSENVFNRDTTAILIGNPSQAGRLDSLNLTVFSNSFVDDSVSVTNLSDKVFNAEYNWWGSQNASVVDGAVSNGNVDYSPWLNSDNDEATFGFQGDYSAVTLGDGPSYDTTRNELQEAYNQTIDTLTIVGLSPAYDSLSANKSLTLVSIEDTLNIDSLKVSADLGIEGKLLVARDIEITSGNLQTLENSQVILGTDVQDIDEENGRLIGQFTIVPRTITSEQTLTILGLSILQGGSDMGLVQVTRINGDGTAIGPTETTNESIDVRWIIDVENDPLAEGRDVSFAWRAEDDNEKDFTEASAEVWRLGEEEGATWQAVGTGNAVVATSRELRSVGVEDVRVFSTWTVSTINKPLPVTLTDFTARLEESSVRLHWITASEINSDYFGIERSTDGQTYQPLGRRPAAANSQTEQHYQYVDEGVANRLAGTVYYRLHMVDFDGSSEYSPLVAVSLEGESDLLVYANRDGTFKLFASLPEEAYTVQVSDLLGNIVYEAHLPTQPNVREYALPVPALPRSVYTLRCLGAKDLFIRKFRVE